MSVQILTIGIDDQNSWREFCIISFCRHLVKSSLILLHTQGFFSIVYLILLLGLFCIGYWQGFQWKSSLETFVVSLSTLAYSMPLLLDVVVVLLAGWRSSSMTEKEGKKVKVTTIITVTTSNYFVNVFFLQFYQSKSLYDIVFLRC